MPGFIHIDKSIDIELAKATPATLGFLIDQMATEVSNFIKWRTINDFDGDRIEVEINIQAVKDPSKEPFKEPVKDLVPDYENDNPYSDLASIRQNFQERIDVANPCSICRTMVNNSSHTWRCPLCGKTRLPKHLG